MPYVGWSSRPGRRCGLSRKCLRFLPLPATRQPASLRPVEHAGGCCDSVSIRFVQHFLSRPTGSICVTAQWEETAKRTGIPQAIVSDHGSDVKKGSEQFAAEHPGSVTIHDAAHFGAILRKRRLEAHPQWSRLITRLGQLRRRSELTYPLRLFLCG